MTTNFDPKLLGAYKNCCLSPECFHTWTDHDFNQNKFCPVCGEDAICFTDELLTFLEEYRKNWIDTNL
jgi:hypothetical protein